MLRFARSFQTSAFRRLAAGDAVPSVALQNGAPSQTVNLAEKTAKGKFVVIGLPGAFSPGCSRSHVPQYIREFKQFQNKGVERLFVVTVNDSFVTGAWKESLLKTAETPEAESYFDVLADSKGEFARDWDVLFDASAFFGNHRSKRYAAIVENGKVTKAYHEPDATGVNESKADKVLKDL